MFECKSGVTGGRSRQIFVIFNEFCQKLKLSRQSSPSHPKSPAVTINNTVVRDPKYVKLCFKKYPM